MATFELDLLGESLHKGRPKDEEPHVKRAVSKKGNDSGIEYIVRIDLEELGILEDEFEELQTLFQVKVLYPMIIIIIIDGIEVKTRLES